MMFQLLFMSMNINNPVFLMGKSEWMGAQKISLLTWSLTLKLLIFWLIHLGEIWKWSIVICFYYSITFKKKPFKWFMSLFFNYVSNTTCFIMTLFNIWVPAVYLLLCEERKAWFFWLPINNKVWGSITDAEYLVVQFEDWAMTWLS